jgi:Flp pilus assembly protein TadG
MQDRNNERGSTIVILAAVITVLLGFAALSVDMGLLYSARASAQKAADAAALGGAFVFVTNPQLIDDTTGQNTIKAYAIAAAAANKIYGTSVSVAPGDVTVDFVNRRVTVQVTNTQNTLFARVLGQNTAVIHTTAVAEASKISTGTNCTRPWFIPNTALASSTPPNAEALCDTTKNGVTTPGACSMGHILIDPTTLSPTSWGLAKLGAQFTLKPKNPNAALSPGQFFAIRLGDSAGGNDYRTNIEHCPAQAIYCAATGESYTTENGDMVGPTKQGTCSLITYNHDAQCNGPKDTYNGIADYIRPDGTHSPTSRSLVLAPIIDVCKYCPAGPPSGQTQLTVMGFALVFIEDVQGNDVIARLISITGCTDGSGSGGGSIDPKETGPYSVPVRLVRTS